MSLPLSTGTWYFKVRAVESDPILGEVPGSYRSVTILVDQAPPTIAATVTGPNAGGWFRSALLNWVCADAGGSGLASCTADQTITTSGSYPAGTFTGTATDGVGNAAQAPSPAFSVDSLSPGPFGLSSPTNEAIFASAPKFVWTEAVDAHSGTVRYEVVAHYGGADRVIAVTTGPKATDATFGTGGVSPPALPLNEDITWFVRAFDAAGNPARVSGDRVFVIDPSAPAPATFTAGPGEFTNDTTPTFSWTGSGPSYNWALIPAGADNPIQQGSGVSTQTTVGTLGPGSYTFRVRQVSVAGIESQEATYPFTLDTTPPAAPVIDTRPISGSKDITPAFSWRGEAHATYTWRVIGAGGGVVRGGSTQTTSLTLAPLTPGPYTFQISQTDRAGNTSPVTAEPFSIIGPSGLQAGNKLSLPTTNHRRLRPRKGMTVATRRPVLRWTSGPRTTTLYNVQLFRVMKRAGGTSRVAKVFSTFPRALQYRVPSKRTRPGTCYVWRVWPYLGTHFSKKPLGISNFCIASKATLRKVAQRKAARTRAARAARAAR